MEKFGKHIVDFSDFIWGAPVLILLLGGGTFFLLYSKLVPLKERLGNKL